MYKPFILCKALSQASLIEQKTSPSILIAQSSICHFGLIPSSPPWTLLVKCPPIERIIAYTTSHSAFIEIKTGKAEVVTWHGKRIDIACPRIRLEINKQIIWPRLNIQTWSWLGSVQAEGVGPNPCGIYCSTLGAYATPDRKGCDDLKDGRAGRIDNLNGEVGFGKTQELTCKINSFELGDVVRSRRRKGIASKGVF